MRLCGQNIDNAIRKNTFDLDLYQIENGKDFTAIGEVLFIYLIFHLPNPKLSIQSA